MREGDQLVQIVDQAMAEAIQKSGSWLACRVGCSACCIGPFPITQLDALRLREGLADLASRDPERAHGILGRARASVAKITVELPDNPLGSLLAGEEAGEDEPCPALDPATGACDLYAARPIACRTFGPPVRFPGEEALMVCELCFRGATDAEIAACSVEVDTSLEAELVQDLERATGAAGDTTVARALAEYRG